MRLKTTSRVTYRWCVALGDPNRGRVSLLIHGFTFDKAPEGAFFYAIKTVTYCYYITEKNLFYYEYEYEEEITLIFVTIFELLGNICRIESNKFIGVRHHEGEATGHPRKRQHNDYLQRGGFCSFLFRGRHGVTRSAVTTTRTVFVVSVMVMAIISERGLASTFRNPLIRPVFPTLPIAAQHA